jgi:L-alanine-DL-glutamate epimerase-like enolase superfamily enzyme
VYLKAGITGLRKAMVAAELLGVNLEIHAANAPLLDVANLHVAGAARNCRYIETHHPVFRFGLRGDPLTPDAAGMLIVPTAPGLGVDLDWDWLDRHTIQERSSRLP